MDTKSKAPTELVLATGLVTYTVTLRSGYKDIPTGGQLDIKASLPGSTVAGSCATGSSGNLALRTDLASVILPSTVIACNITVPVTTEHQRQGKVPGFTVTAVISGPQVGPEFYVPVLETLDVPVYTGGSLGAVDSTVLISAGKYIPGKLYSHVSCVDYLQGMKC